MASVSSSTSGVGSASSLRGFGGLSSGLDRDSLIEGMTAATRAKIAKQQKSRQSLLWKQEAYQSVSSKLVEFANKYTSYLNPTTNLSSPSFWGRSSITALGENEKYVKVTGSSPSVNTISVAGVKQMAQQASKVSKGAVSGSALSTGGINMGKASVSNLEGGYITFQYGSKTYSVDMLTGEDYDYSTSEGITSAIKESLKKVTIGNGQTLGDVIQVSVTGENEDMRLEFKLNEKDTNSLWVAGGNEKALDALGFSNIKSMSDEERRIDSNGFSELVKGKQQVLSQELSFAERVADKSMSFTYNGVTKSIKFGSQEEIEKLFQGKTDAEALDLVAEDMQKKLDDQFGKDRIDVRANGEKLEFRAMIPGSRGEETDENGNIQKTIKVDYSSILSISSADRGILGSNGALNVSNGASNRLNLDVSILNSGLDSLAGSDKKKSDPLKIKINDVEITGLTYGSSVNEIMNAINSSDAGVKVSYLKNADKFIFESTVDGAAGRVKFESTEEYKDMSGIFGTNFSETEGLDAIVSVKYGTNSDPIELVRGSNSFNLDGLNITVSGTFGYKEDNTIDKTQEVTFSGKADGDKIVNALNDMIKDYNEIIELVNKQLTKKPNRDYSPLTEDQKNEMTEDQIKNWEDKAKEGILFNDSELRSLSDSLRFIFDAGSDDKALLSSFGISTSSNYGDKGKLVFNETEFRAALESRPEDIQKIFTKKEDTSDGQSDGLMAKLTEITDRYASTKGAVKGTLIEKAGSVYAPSNVLSNTLQKSIDSIDKYIKQLQTRLSDENDRYIKQFTNLEKVISQMNSQSSWLNSSLGG
ncbi:flagellar filament capping protein FliD [Clostridium sp. HBUAS56010]|uniref:flagellar filament capping protein FliD n=1 Tax=Clostridium sp. HBUAS56010 TaxID=2571127 RepID=UPI00163D718B|nr:flagellar filament capping protein FliD [Clostridium sp. HBUAS56010]